MEVFHARHLQDLQLTMSLNTYILTHAVDMMQTLIADHERPHASHP
jgi:hypothetical protein